MADDELSAPLGQNAKKKRRWQLPIALPQAIAGLLGTFVAVCVGWALVVSDPLGGEPAAVVMTGMPSVKPKLAMPVVTSPGGSVQGPRSYDGPGSPPPSAVVPIPPPPAATPSGSKTVTIIDGSTGKRQEVAIPTTQDVRAPVDQRLLETSRHGPIPKIAPDGARPADIYARAAKPVAGRKEGPRIAIVLTGLGVSTAATQDAIAKMPAAVTFAFVPYGAEVERAATRARAEGHELLLQLPMEPFDYPDNDPGPQTLLMSLPTEQNLDRLYWLMSRFQGYVGVANYMGARFTSSEHSLGPVMKETGRRGLIWFDDGASPRSLAGQIAGANNLPYAKAEIVLDAVPTPVQIDRALSRLEASARERGRAVGVAAALPSSIERIALWLKAAEIRGVTVVPITSLAIKPKSS